MRRTSRDRPEASSPPCWPSPRRWRYGYDLSKETGLKSGTLYPLLIRLSDQGLLEAEWRQPCSLAVPPATPIA